VARAILAKLRHDVARLNEGDYRPLLRSYADDAVLVFHDGNHRWAGEHRGKATIEGFLQDLTAAGLRGEITGFTIAGPPWALTLWGRFDDRAIKTSWGRIVRHEDFYLDTGRIEAFDRRLTDLGVAPARPVSPSRSGR
jgi:hypothetical protein